MKHISSRRIAQITAVVSLVFVPTVVFAYTNNICDLVKIIVGYFNIAIEVILGLAVVVFVFNVYRYFFTSKENKERGMYILWSVIGFFVIFSIWGLVNLVTNTFNLNSSAPTIFGNVFGGNNSGSSPCTTSATSQPSINGNNAYTGI